MRRFLFTLPILIATAWVFGSVPSRAQVGRQAPAGQVTPAMLTVDSIMRGPKLVGAPPSAVRWSSDSSKIYFTWQKPDQNRSATFVVDRDGSGLRQLSTEEARAVPATPPGRIDRARRRVLAVENGDVVVFDLNAGTRRVLVRTAAMEANPRWARNDTAVTFTRDGNLYLLTLDGSGETTLAQLTDIVTADTAAAGRAGGGGARGAGAGRAGGAAASSDTDAQRLLREQERGLIDFIRRQAEERQSGEGRGGGGRGGAATGPPARPIARLELTARQTLADLQLSADERYVWIGVTERPDATARTQDVPSYVTESAYPEMIAARSNVGDVQTRRRLAVMDLRENRTVWFDATAFAGAERKTKAGDPDVPRLVDWGPPEFSADGRHGVIAVRAQDNKDRWLVRVDPATGKAAVLDHLHDDAWIRELSIAGGGVLGGTTPIAWLPGDEQFVFLSEKSGFMHVYRFDVVSEHAQALTSGRWEITSAQLSSDRRTLFLTTNEVHPGERHFYTMPVAGGRPRRITTMTGSNEATVSPDERTLAIVHSYTNKPPELFVMPLAADAAAKAVTTTPTDEWRAFKWIDPKVVTYKARDGVEVYARLFTPEMAGARRDPKKPAVVFVHGAGYLQNAHKYWSTYYREYMFHNLLASRGYVVLDPDYRASSGYGRDWRTAIYRHMGGHDLEDVVDGAKYLVAVEKVDAKRIGVYGGSYGGFITLMAMFTTPDVFAAGAALRPVTDWSHYNHGYTSNILNVPQVDAEAYKKSSPIFFAEGLKGRLLICHGMVDTNVFFQDSVRLVQRLIELRKENWEVAPYPVENHAFTEETSWADEYKRILALFETTLRK
jgi:dipeptidyl aminopeptidase/acylaminoacyl peptidase